MIAPAHWLVGLLMAAGIACGSVAWAQDVNSGHAGLQGGRPECPHDWDAKHGQLEEVKPILDIPEFHDCQRFIVRDASGSVRYDSLFAIFAVSNLASIEPRLDSSRVCATCLVRPDDSRERPTRVPNLRTRATTLGVVAARIYAEGIYEPLGIRQMHSCLYLFRAGESWGAIMVAARDASSSCAVPVNPASMPSVTELEVRRQVVSGAELADYPPVARWDWDNVNARQYIGIMCGAGWCEVGPPGFTPSDLPRFESGIQPEFERVGRIKGWYDEQFLAFVDQEGHTAPSLLRGRIFPARVLETYRNRDTTSLGAGEGRPFERWTTAAWIVLDTLPSVGGRALAGLAASPFGDKAEQVHQYKSRLNFDTRHAAGAVILRAELNALQICNGSKDACAISGDDREGLATCDTPATWWARIGSSEGTWKYLCARRRGHENLKTFFDVPGTARWRWMASDEGVWHACGQGCCETLGPGG